jgi:hypothetical protein
MVPPSENTFGKRYRPFAKSSVRLSSLPPAPGERQVEAGKEKTFDNKSNGSWDAINPGARQSSRNRRSAFFPETGPMGGSLKGRLR